MGDVPDLGDPGITSTPPVQSHVVVPVEEMELCGVGCSFDIVAEAQLADESAEAAPCTPPCETGRVYEWSMDEVCK